MTLRYINLWLTLTLTLTLSGGNCPKYLTNTVLFRLLLPADRVPFYGYRHFALTACCHGGLRTWAAQWGMQRVQCRLYLHFYYYYYYYYYYYTTILRRRKVECHYKGRLRLQTAVKHFNRNPIFLHLLSECHKMGLKEKSARSARSISLYLHSQNG